MTQHVDWEQDALRSSELEQVLEHRDELQVRGRCDVVVALQL